MIHGLLPLCDLFDHPGERCAQALPEHRPTGFADGRQPMERPFLRTAVPQLAHEQIVLGSTHLTPDSIRLFPTNIR